MGEPKNQAPFDIRMIVRTIVLFVAWINHYLVMKGNSPIPINDAELELGATALITFVISMWAWWKNNDVSFKARRNTQYLKDKGIK
ncbi:phage holin [Paenisporosarcina sp. TG20]|uniref:phage holin n=1 Tax=Paenisporosarcina sp. TG20 TaxID=1211706 RepID=UPI0002E8250C|nr:phage holin [Paenisporosarcina sp. TG20]